MKKNLWIITALLLLLIVAGCSSETSGDPEARPGDEAIVLKMAHHWAAQSVSGRGFQYFADVVNEKSDGQIKVEVYAADSLVTGNEMYEAMLDGVVDIGYVTTSQISPSMKPCWMEL